MAALRVEPSKSCVMPPPSLADYLIGFKFSVVPTYSIFSAQVHFSSFRVTLILFPVAASGRGTCAYLDAAMRGSRQGVGVPSAHLLILLNHA